MKVGDKFYTEDGKGIFYSERIIEITEIKGEKVEYKYLESHGLFYRSLRDFSLRTFVQVSPVMELFEF